MTARTRLRIRWGNVAALSVTTASILWVTWAMLDLAATQACAL